MSMNEIPELPLKPVHDDGAVNAGQAKTSIGASISALPDSKETGAPILDPALEKRIVRECDWTVIPPAFVLFMVTFW
jgi:hypothetical protein